MTPGTYCLHFQLSYTAGYSHFSQTYSSISYIIWMFLWTLRGPSLYSFPVWWKKAGLLTYSTISSSSLHYRHVTCSGGPQWRSLIMFYLLWARRNESKLLREHQLSCLFIYFCVFFFLCVMFFFPFFRLQLSSRLSTLIKIWSMCTPSWTSAFSPDWRWAPIHSRSPLSPDQWAA